MQLRHHLGPLNTIPFGEIKNVNDFSRDWVIIKLPLRLTFDTDAEKVRKLINNRQRITQRRAGWRNLPAAAKVSRRYPDG